MIEYFEKLKALRGERAHLLKENSEPPIIGGGPFDGFINAKYARALRVQQINKEIDARKREAFSLLYGGRS